MIVIWRLHFLRYNQLFTCTFHLIWTTSQCANSYPFQIKYTNHFNKMCHRRNSKFAKYYIQNMSLSKDIWMNGGVIYWLVELFQREIIGWDFVHWKSSPRPLRKCMLKKVRHFDFQKTTWRTFSIIMVWYIYFSY